MKRIRMLSLIALLAAASLVVAEPPASQPGEARGDVALSIYLPPGPAMLPVGDREWTYPVVIEVRNEGADPLHFKLPVPIDERDMREGPRPGEPPRGRRIFPPGKRLVLVLDIKRQRAIADHSGPIRVTEVEIPPGESRLIKAEIPGMDLEPGRFGLQAVLDEGATTIAQSERADVTCVAP